MYYYTYYIIFYYEGWLIIELFINITLFTQLNPQ